jgi:hypothetical protein
MAKASESELKAAVSRIKELKPEHTISHLSRPSQISSLRRTLGNRLQPVFAAAGLDITKIDEILADHQNDVRHIWEKQKALASKEFSHLAKHYQQYIDNRNRAHLDVEPLPVTTIFLETPYLITATTSDMLVQNPNFENPHIEPLNSWGKIVVDDQTEGNYVLKKLTFYFAWQNPSNYVAVIHTNADLFVQGFLQANAMPGLFFGGDTSVNVFAESKVHLGGFEITGQYGQTNQIATLNASGGIEVFGGGGDFKNAAISGAYNVSVNSNIDVDGDEIVVFEVSLVVACTIDNGHILAEFSDQGSVTCPGVIVELLSPPDMSGVSSATTMSRRKPTRTKTRKADRTSKSKSTRKKRRKG